MASASFNGLRVLTLESRRSREIGTLIENLGGVPVVAPSVKEVALDSNQQALDFANNLADGSVDMVIFTTGVGVRTLASAVESTCSREELARRLNQVTIVARGPKPTAALKELGVRVSLTVPEPNTWRELVTTLDQNKEKVSLSGCRIAIQEYGVTNPELSAALAARGATVTLVNVYEWALPDDIEPLERAIESVIRGDIHVLLVASSVQIRHLFEIAEKMQKTESLHEALSRVVITSVGPLTSEELRSRGLSVDIECTRPKMGFLVQEAAEKAPELLKTKHLNK